MLGCKLIIKDEVNIKLDGLPADVRRNLVKSFKFILPHAKYQAAYRLGRWDGSVSFFGIGGDGYLSQVPKIIEVLYENGYEITDIEDHRKPITLDFQEVGEDLWGDKTWPEGHQHAGKLVRLRDDQVAALNLFLKNPQCLQELATGYGKTILTASMVKLVEQYGRTLTIVPSKDLVIQTAEDFVNLGLDTGVYYGTKKEYDKTHTISTWQGLSVLVKKSKESEEDKIKLAALLSDITTVIVDEAHTINGDELNSLLIKFMSHTPIRWAITGTIPKEEYIAEKLYTSIGGHVINRVAASDLQERGILSSCHINICQLIDIREFRDYAEELKYLVTNQDRLKFVASLISTIGDSGNTLVLVGRIETGKELIKMIPGATFVSGNLKSKDRKSEYDEFKTTNSKILIATSGVAAVGINIVSLYNLVLFEPGKSFVKVIQSIGRGLRKGFDKDHVEIWDITSTCKYSKRHLTTRKKFYKEANYKFSQQKIDWDE
jgi:superfamily II DNA or RNA helicase